jgi:hypothetical protein
VDPIDAARYQLFGQLRSCVPQERGYDPPTTLLGDA